MSEVEYGKFKTSKRVWYALYGLVPLTDNSTADIIQKYNLKNVKAESKMTIVPMTIEIEGDIEK
ncbi:MAG: hypothetical protein ABIL37_05815 [candidate division WOR-3 bacterium]